MEAKEIWLCLTAQNVGTLYQPTPQHVLNVDTHCPRSSPQISYQKA